MVASITHAHVLGVPDQTEPYDVNGVAVDPADTVQPSHWDADHTIVGLFVEDPGAAWQAETVVAQGDLIAVGPQVFRCITAGTTSDTEPAWAPYYGTFAPVADGTAEWISEGTIDAVRYDMLPPLRADTATESFVTNTLGDYALQSNVDTLTTRGELVLRYTLSAADLAALDAGDFELIPAPGAGLYILPSTWSAVYTPGATPHDAAQDSVYIGSVEFYPAGGSTAWAVGSDASVSLGPLVPNGNTFDPASLENLPLRLMQRAVGTAGDGVLKIVCRYTIESLT